MLTRYRKRKKKQQQDKRLHLICWKISSWPALPARYESLNDDVLGLILQFVGNKSYRSFGGLNYQCNEIYLSTQGMEKETFVYGYMPLENIKHKVHQTSKRREYFCGINLARAVLYYNRKDVFEWLLTEDDVNNQRKKKYLLRVACELAATEGKIDLLQQVYSTDTNSSAFQSIVQFAASTGQVVVFRWIRNRKIFVDWFTWLHCVEISIRKNQPNILKWILKHTDESSYNKILDYQTRIETIIREES